MESSSSSSLAPGGLREGHSRSSSGASAHSLGAQSHGVTTSTPRSLSMNSISSDGSLPSDSGGATAGQAPLVEQEDIVVLTHNVRSFKESLGKLKRIFHPDKEKRETVHVAAHERLGDVLRILRSILEKYPDIQSTDLLMSAGTLIQQVKSYSYENDKEDPTEFLEAIDQLALSFSSRVSEYLMGDLDSSSGVPLSKTKSFDNLLTTDPDTTESPPHGLLTSGPILTHAEVDQRLMLLSEGVDLALKRAKVWSKYAKDVMTYIEKRAALESECARNLSKLAQLTRPILKEESYLPFQSIYCTAIDQDLENTKAHIATCNLLQGQKFIEPLSNRRAEHEKSRKQIKETWQRELKRTHEAINNLRKAKSLYVQRHVEHEKAKEAALRAVSGSVSEEASRVERKKKMEDDAHQRALEAETTYKSCVMEANSRQQELEKVKGVVLQQVRELIYQCDQTMKAVTVCYFQLQHTVSAAAPVQYQTLCDSSRLYEPGTQYMEFVRRLPVPPDQHNPIIPHCFEPFHSLADRSTESLDDSTQDCRSTTDSKGSHLQRAWIHGTPLAAVVAAGGMGGSDSDSVSSFHSNKSQDSPTASPCVQTRKHTSAAASSGEELETDHEQRGECRSCMSRAAETHNFRKLKTPSRCRECDSYVYFQGTECTECGLACHRKCLESLAIQCGHRRLLRKMTTFGVALVSQSATGSSSSSPVTSPRGSSDQTAIPDIVLKCMEEIEKKGIFIKGIYRVSGVKSKVEKLCQSFESGAELVDLTEVHPSIIANVLKLYLRQLPEPLLTYRLYPEFIRIAKDHPSQKEDDLEAAAKELIELVSQLPPVHLATLAALMSHLKKISEYSEHNHMPPSNLGIVFGPTLLRTSDGSASLTSLVDTVHQTRVVEILIKCAEMIFAKNTHLRGGSSEHVPVRTYARGMPSPLTRERAQELDLEEEEEDGDESGLPSTTIANESVGSVCREPMISTSLPGSEDHSSDDWLGSSVFSDDELSEILGSSEASPLQQKCSMSSVEEGQSECPVPPPRKNAAHHQTPLSTSSSSSGDQVYMSTAQVTLGGGGGSLPSRTSAPTPTMAELRRQFFESPPVVLKAVSHSLPPSPPPSFSSEVAPSTPTTAKLLAQAASMEECSPTVERTSATGLTSARTASEKGYRGLSSTSSPLTSSISHLGLNTLLRPFSSVQLGSNTSQQHTSRHYNGKWTTLSSSTSGSLPVSTRQEVVEETREVTSSSGGFWKEATSVQKTTESSYTVQQHSESSGYESDKGMSRHTHYV